MAIDVEFTDPGIPPSSSDAVNFRTRADAFVAYIVIFVTKLIAFVAQINSTEANINAKEASATLAATAAAASANFQGVFIQGVSSALTTQSWAFNGIIYRAIVDTTNSPALSPSSWVSMGMNDVIHAAPADTPTDDDEWAFWDGATSGLKKISSTNFKAWMKSFFDVIYSPIYPVGSVIQEVTYQTGALVAGTTQIPFDNTTPQISEGTQFMSVAFSAKKATSKLKISVVFNGSITSVSYRCSIAIFKDSGVDAIGSGFSGQQLNFCIQKTITIDAIDTSSHTFTVRAGASGGVNTYMNGSDAGVQVFNGTSISSITITEISQ